MNYEQIEKKRYEQSWAALKGKFVKDPFSYRSREVSVTAIDFLKFLKTKKIKGKFLDIGCGNARHAILFAKNDFESYGIDIATSAIKLAKKNAKENKVTLNLRVGSVFSLPYPENHFDVVMDSGCLHHLRKTEWGKYKKNILRVLRSGGYYYLYCFSKNTPVDPPFSAKKRNWTLRGKHYNHFFTKKEVVDYFARNFKFLKNYEIKKTAEGRVLKLKVFYMQKK